MAQIVVEMYAIEKSPVEVMFYCGGHNPSTRWDMKTGKASEYVPVIWSETIFDATRFTTREEAIEIAKLIARDIGHPVRVIPIKVRRNKAA